MMRAIVAAVTAVVLATAIATAATAGEGQGYVVGPMYYHFNQSGSGLPPFLLAPAYPYDVFGCWQSRFVRTPLGWVRQKVWVCS